MRATSQISVRLRRSLYNQAMHSVALELERADSFPCRGEAHGGITHDRRSDERADFAARWLHRPCLVPMVSAQQTRHTLEDMTLLFSSSRARWRRASSFA
jgi:hypothetical protein